MSKRTNDYSNPYQFYNNNLTKYTIQFNGKGEGYRVVLYGKIPIVKNFVNYKEAVRYVTKTIK